MDQLVSHFGAVQAQDFAGALWGVGQRVPHATEQIVEQALRERRIVRSWPMRGTLHFVGPDDLRWMLDLLSMRILKRMSVYFRKEGLHESDFSKGRKIIERELQDGRALDRVALYSKFKEGGLDPSGQRGLHVVLKLALDQVLCFGSRVGKQQTFVLLDEWVPSITRLSPDESWGRLATLYFQSHGPATARDFAWWTGATIAEANRAIDMIGSTLNRQTVDKRHFYWIEGPVSRRSKRPAVRLLPAFDEFLIGYQDRSDIQGDVPKKSITRDSIFVSTVVIDGKIVGTWRRTISAKGVRIESNFFVKPTPSEKEAFEKEKIRYAQFLGVELIAK